MPSPTWPSLATTRRLALESDFRRKVHTLPDTCSDASAGATAQSSSHHRTAAHCPCTRRHRIHSHPCPDPPCHASSQEGPSPPASTVQEAPQSWAAPFIFAAQLCNGFVTVLRVLKMSVVCTVASLICMFIYNLVLGCRISHNLIGCNLCNGFVTVLPVLTRLCSGFVTVLHLKKPGRFAFMCT